MSMQKDLPKKKKIVLRSNKKSQVSVESNKRQENISIRPLANHNYQQTNRSSIINVSNNNNSLEIYEDDRKHGFMFLLDNQEDKSAIDQKVLPQSQQKFAAVKIEVSKETSVNGESESNTLSNLQQIVKIQSLPIVKGLHKKGCISLSTLTPRLPLLPVRTKSLVSSPSKQYLQITLKSSVTSSPNSSFINKKLSSLNNQMKQQQKIKKSQNRRRIQHNIQKNLIQLSSNLVNLNILKRCSSKSNKVSKLAIKSHKYEEIQPSFSKKNSKKCSSIRMIATDNKLNK